MLSVTQRIKSVSQPKNGYVPKSLFHKQKYYDDKEVQELNPTLSIIQGLAVDYLTRFMMFGNIYSAFEISIKGALLLDEAYERNDDYANVSGLLSRITGIDYQSVVNACKVVCYDSVFRAGIKSYQPAEDVEYNEAIYSNIPILVNRTISFLHEAGPIIKDGFTFNGGYTKLVSSGDGDYLTPDMLIDLKVSKNVLSTNWSLQLLMYYLLGIHSIHTEFTSIKKLCIFNPYFNESYICNINDISDESKYTVSQDVLGYKMKYSFIRWDKHLHSHTDYSTWDKIDGSDIGIVKEFLTDNFVSTGFSPEKYDNGIFDITIDDYWTFLRKLDEYKQSLRPLFRHTEYVKLLKNNDYYMFVSVSARGKYSLLQGARLHALKYPIDYYYDNLERYASAIVLRFSKYWDALREVSKHIKSLEPTEEFYRDKYFEYLCDCKVLKIPKKKQLSFDEWYTERKSWFNLSGKIHGCIVDIDWSNHIYINPYDGTVVSYNAASMYDKNVYKNTRSLLSAQRPEMLASFDELISKNKTDSHTALLVQNEGVHNPLLVQTDDISQESVKVYDYDMYAISNRLKPLQAIYDIKWIQVWYDDVLHDDTKLIEEKYATKQKETEQRKSTNPKPASSIDSKNGIIISNTQSNEYRELYVGMTRKMNCGLNATIIDYKNYKNVTIQFEDGLIRTGIRSDHFRNGKVAHINSDHECGFDRNKECNTYCKYYNTCTRRGIHRTQTEEYKEDDESIKALSNSGMTLKTTSDMVMKSIQAELSGNDDSPQNQVQNVKNKLVKYGFNPEVDFPDIEYNRGTNRNCDVILKYVENGSKKGYDISIFKGLKARDIAKVYICLENGIVSEDAVEYAKDFVRVTDLKVHFEKKRMQI